MRWYDLGPFRILQRPLVGNPFWSAFHIYRAGVLLGKLVSVPSLADCEHVERWGTRYADSAPTKVLSYKLRGASKPRTPPSAES
mgnify:FL=1